MFTTYLDSIGMLVTVLRYVLTVYSHLRKMNTPSAHCMNFFLIEIGKNQGRGCNNVIFFRYIGICYIFSAILGFSNAIGAILKQFLITF